MGAGRDAEIDGLLRDWARAVLPGAFPPLAVRRARNGAEAPPAGSARGPAERPEVRGGHGVPRTRPGGHDAWDPLTQPLGPAFWRAMDLAWSAPGLAWALPEAWPRAAG